MAKEMHPIYKLLQDDPRYTLEAYQFVREALGYAQDVLKMGVGEEGWDEESGSERHLSGQQLCEAIRRYALDQYGYMAKVVLNSWGLKSTGDFGDIVYNLIGIGWMKKSDEDRRDHFDDVFDFDQAFQLHFEITSPE